MFFAPVVVDYIFGGVSAVNPLVDDVPDEDLQFKIRKVCLPGASFRKGGGWHSPP